MAFELVLCDQEVARGGPRGGLPTKLQSVKRPEGDRRGAYSVGPSWRRPPSRLTDDDSTSWPRLADTGRFTESQLPAGFPPWVACAGPSLARPENGRPGSERAVGGQEGRRPLGWLGALPSRGWWNRICQGVMVHRQWWLVIVSKVTPAASITGRCASMGASDDMAWACSKVSHTLTLMSYPCSRSMAT